MGISRRDFLKASAASASGLVLTPNAFAQTSSVASGMASAAARFLEALPAPVRSSALLPFATERRYNWHWFPSYDRDGPMLVDLGAQARDRAFELLEASTSAMGYKKARQIMSLQTELGRDPMNYHVAVYGQPSATGTWGWRLEGHHLSLHYTVVRGQEVVLAPFFLGASPTTVREGPRAGLRTMRREEEAGRELVRSLDAESRSRVVFATQTPGDTVTQNAVRARPLERVGLTLADLSAAQRGLVQEIVGEYLGVAPAGVATPALERVRQSDPASVRFGWSGSLEPNQRHYYRLQGPGFLLEYDNSRDSGTHIHSQWRDFEGDWGRNLL